MDIVIKIANKRIRELISEAGSGYWAHSLKFRFNGRESTTLAFSIVEHGDTNNAIQHTVTKQMVIDGITKMANAKPDQGGHHFAAVRDWKQSDMYTGDAIIQFAIFGELKYG